MVNDLNTHQEAFVNYLFQGLTHRAAFIKAFNPPPERSMRIIDSSASRLARRARVTARLHELNAEVAKRLVDDKVMSEQERREVLTAIARAKMGDFIDVQGNVDLTKPESLNSPAISGIKKTLWSGGKGGQASSETVTLTIRDPLAAIKELNLMDRVYSEASAFIRDEHKEVNIYVIDSKAKHLLAKVRERTGKLIAGGDDDGNDSKDT